MDIYHKTVATIRNYEEDVHIDSTGLGTGESYNYLRDVRLPQLDKRFKPRADFKNVWTKLHAMTGATTNMITAFCITPNYGDGSNDSINFIPLLNETVRQGIRIKSVCADKGYLSKKSIQAVFDYGGIAYIPMKKDSKPGAGDDPYSTLYEIYTTKKDLFEPHYATRNRIESVFGAFQYLYGKYLDCHLARSRFVELVCRIIAWNLRCIVILECELKQRISFRAGSTFNRVGREVA